MDGYLENQLDRKFAGKWMPPQIWDAVTAPTLAAELLEKITAYKIGVAKNFVKMALDTGHVGDDLGTQTGPFVPLANIVAMLETIVAERATAHGL